MLLCDDGSFIRRNFLFLLKSFLFSRVSPTSAVIRRIFIFINVQKKKKKLTNRIRPSSFFVVVVDVWNMDQNIIRQHPNWMVLPKHKRNKKGHLIF